MHIVKPHRSCGEMLSVTVKLICKKAHVSASHASSWSRRNGLPRKVKNSPFSFSIFIIILVWYHSRLLFVSSIRILFSFILFYSNSRINYCIWFLDCVILLWSAFEHCMEFALYKLLLLLLLLNVYILW